MRFVFTPDWFLGNDVLIEFFSFLVLTVFFIMCIRNYKLNKNKRIRSLGIGFALIALAQLAMVATKFVLYYDTSVTTQIGQIIISTNVVRSIDTIYNISFFAHRILTLLGLYVIYRLPGKKRSATDFLLGFYFILISAFLSNEFYYLFHVTALILLGLITYNYYLIYKKNRFVNTKILVAAFGMLALSQLLFIMSKLEFVYVAANIIELISYLVLLVLIIRIWKHGKKKKSNGYNIRHFRNHPAKRR